MNTQLFDLLAGHPLVTSVGWTLVHFVWQAAFIGGVIALALATMRQASARTRYGVACLGLVIMTIVPAVTLGWLITGTDSADWQARASAPPQSFSTAVPNSEPSNNVSIIPVQPGKIADRQEPAEQELAFTSTGSKSDEVVAGLAGTVESNRGSASSRLPDWLPWLVVIWTLGVTCLAVRLLAGLIRVRRWRHEGVAVDENALVEAVNRLAKRMDMGQSIRILTSARSMVPAVIGWIRPAILVPASMLSGLTTAELESILAHELAHIRRHDYLVNLLQTVVETLLFYHPIVWWLSLRIRAERENCCDDIAVEVCGNRVVFARALAHMEEIRCRDERIALAASGGSLIGRIRRIAGTEPVCAGPWWPAGVVVLGSLGMLLGGLWMTVATADPVLLEKIPIVASHENPSEVLKRPEDDYNLKKSEVRKTDSKTGIEKRLFADIKLEYGEDKRQKASVDMMYSNVMMYTFIPARIAKQLGAAELGEIDFGTEAPPRDRPAQTMFVPQLHDPAVVADASGEKPEEMPTLEAHELMGPIEEGVTVVPYADDAIWIPGHLGFYGMNQTRQHVFKIVRIEKVDLGVGPAFGPVNALVLDDANSDFGVLGSNWVRKVRDGKGKLLWFDFTRTFHFMVTPGHLKEADPQSTEAANPPKSPSGKITVESSGHSETPDRLERDGVKVLATHTYPDSFRESTGWVELNGAQVPVDVGIEHNGITVYKTLMFDIVAVDSKTEKTIWSIDWGKTMPMWNTVSIVELNRDGESELAVELYAANQKTRELVYKYFSLATGEKVQPPVVPESSEGPESNRTQDDHKELNFQLVDRDGERITRAAIGAFEHGRSATELVRHLAAPDHNISGFASGVSTTNMESIVSAVDPNYVFDKCAEAAEVIFNLPEGSGLRAEFHGEQVEITRGNESTIVVITGGRIELIDAGGVIRAWASPDGGAEQLVIDCGESLGEVVMKMKTRRIEPMPEYPKPPVQFVMNTNTGAPENEGAPPHGAIRYEVQQGENDGHHFVRMKMKWRYEMKRLLDEAVAESGLTAEDLIYGKQDDEKKPSLPKPMPPERGQKETPTPQQDTPWGALAKHSGLRSRLTLMTEKPIVGQPLLFKLEVKNFGDKPTRVDVQNYAPFRVLRAVLADGKSAPYIGMTPQTDGTEQALKPGEALTLWESVDANGLFLLESGKYRFLAEGGEWAAQAWWQDSNSLEVDIVAGEPTRIQSLLKNLSQGLPEKWQLSSGMGVAEGWNGIYLTHLPTGLKRDATGIQIWFTERKLAHDFELGKDDQKQIVTQLGKCQLGFFNVAAQRATLDIWPEYLEHIRQAASGVLNFEVLDKPEPDAARADNLPWTATGHVTGKDGMPVEGAVVRAHCGIGTLRETGSAKTTKDGSYELHFGPGIHFQGNQGIQAATISVHVDGLTEINMNRQGDLVAAFQLPADGNIGWGGKTKDDLFLPETPKQIDFVMVPSVTVRGIVFDQNGNPPQGVRVSITGEELPPSSSVIDEVRTNDNGEFEIDGIPPGYKFQIMVEPAKAEPPWLAWASAPVVFRYSESDTGLEYEIDGKPVDFTCQQLYLILNGDGVNWKTALKDAAARKLELTWDGISNDKMVRAGMAFLELGEKKD